MLTQTLDISLECVFFISQLRVTVLVEVYITFDVRYLAVPKVEFAALLLIVLFHK